jgi:transcriptional regulator GlxA family with amidase domain
MHSQGATLCSACSGVLLLAETGLLNGKDATMHWAFASTFRQNFPQVRLRLEKVLVIAGEYDQFVMSGASASWYDLVLYLVVRYVGPTAAQAISKFFALQWHSDGQAPYLVFDLPMDHEDAMIRDAQVWLSEHFFIAAPITEVVKQSGIPERSFKRRFSKATGYSPIAYIQCLRIEDAKRRLERTNASIDQISWSVGYEDAASFRRLFKRITGITPGDYRRKFSVPHFAQTHN